MKTYWNVSLQPSQNITNARKLLLGAEDFGVEQYVSWFFPKEELSLDTNWDKFEEFCMPQSNEVWPTLIFLPALGRAKKALMNGTTLYRPTST